MGRLNVRIPVIVPHQEGECRAQQQSAGPGTRGTCVTFCELSCVAWRISVTRHLESPGTPGGTGQGQEALMRRPASSSSDLHCHRVFSVQQTQEHDGAFKPNRPGCGSWRCTPSARRTATSSGSPPCLLGPAGSHVGPSSGEGRAAKGTGPGWHPNPQLRFTWRCPLCYVCSSLFPPAGAQAHTLWVLAGAG